MKMQPQNLSQETYNTPLEVREAAGRGTTDQGYQTHANRKQTPNPQKSCVRKQTAISLS